MADTKPPQYRSSKASSHQDEGALERERAIRKERAFAAVDGVLVRKLVRPAPFHAPQPVEMEEEPETVPPPPLPPEVEEEVPPPPEEIVPKKKRFNFAYGMATLLFVVGMSVAGQGYLTNNKAQEQVEVLAAAVTGEDPENPGEPNTAAPSGLDEAEVTEYDRSSYSVAPNKPRLIRSSELGVNARVLEVGLEGNAVGTPTGVHDAAWFTRSAGINEGSGAMLVVGHVSGPNDPGVFYNLKDAKAGQIIEIEKGDGGVKKFQVTEVHTYNVGNVNMAKALSSSDPSKLGLNLMTCGGDFDVETNSYKDRVLVRAVQIS